MTLTSRLSRLEEAARGRLVVGRVFRVVGGLDPVGADVAAFLAGGGVTLAPGDIVIHRTLYRPGGAGPEFCPQPLRMAA